MTASISYTRLAPHSVCLSSGSLGPSFPVELTSCSISRWQAGLRRRRPLRNADADHGRQTGTTGYLVCRLHITARPKARDSGRIGGPPLRIQGPFPCPSFSYWYRLLRTDADTLVPVDSLVPADANVRTALKQATIWLDLSNII